MKLAIAAVPLFFALAPGWGQTLQFNFDNLAAKAKDKVQVDLSGELLRTALDAAQKAGEKDLGPLAGITGITVRNFEFAQAGAYADSDLDALRAQVASGSGWSRIIDVKEDGEHTEIYALARNGEFGGLLLISAEETELTVVHVTGTLKLADLAKVQELVQSSIKYDLKGAGQ